MEIKFGRSCFTAAGLLLAIPKSVPLESHFLSSTARLSLSLTEGRAAGWWFLMSMGGSALSGILLRSSLFLFFLPMFPSQMAENRTNVLFTVLGFQYDLPFNRQRIRCADKVTH